ncbi:MAG: serine/threonine-protein kinase [Kovacikia sp.]
MGNIQRHLISYCFNPGCLKPQNSDDLVFCSSCGSGLLLQGRYRAVRVLGQGGFGRTFLAIDQSQTPAIPCVVKQLWHENPNLDPPHQAKSLFQQEVQQLGNLGNHPQIPQLLDSFEQDGFLYLVQEYVEGENLATALTEKGSFTVEEIWQILESLLPVLQFMHSHGVIHRDIKPENLIRGQELGSGAGGKGEAANRDEPMADSLFLVDFGAAKVLSEVPLAQPGTVIGSPEYAAPEQVKGKAVVASDLYSLGVTCIHLLTGIRPFNLFDFSNNHWVWRDYWLAGSTYSTGRDDSARLAQILDRLIEPALNQRFPSAEAAIAAVKRIRGKKMVGLVSSPPPPWECYATLVGHQGLFASVNAIAVNRESTLLASASDDKTIRLWDGQTGAERLTLKGHTQFVKSVAFRPQGQSMLATGGSDRTIKLWDLQAPTEIRTLIGHLHAVNALAFSPEGNTLASGSADKTIKLWNPDTGELITTLAGHHLAVNAIAFSPPASPARLLASGSTDSQVKIWDPGTFEPIQSLAGHTAAVRAVAFSPDGRLLASAGEDRTIRLWEVASWRWVRTLSGHPWSVSGLSFSAQGDVLVSSSWDKTVKLWEVSSGNEMTALVGHLDSVNCVAIAPNDGFIASGSQDKTIKLWRRCQTSRQAGEIAQF